MDMMELVQSIFEADPALNHLDVSPGTNLYDLLIIPMAYLLETKLDQGVIDSETSKLDLSNIDSMTVDDVLRIGKNQFIDIARGGASRGEITLNLTYPTEITIPAGAVFYAGKKEFVSVNRVIFASSDYTLGGILYASPPVLVENSDGYSADADEIGSMDNAPSTLASITHNAITPGVTPLTASSLLSVIRGSMISKIYLNPHAAARIIHERFKNIKSIEVVGRGDAKMDRDIVYNYTSPNNAVNSTSDFFGKVRGYVDVEGALQVYNSNRAYKVFATEDELDALDDQSGIEITQQGYVSLLDVNTVYLVVTTESIIDEGFGQGSEVGGSTASISSGVTADDTTLTLGSLAGIEAGQMIKIISYDGEGNKNRVVINAIKSVDSATQITLYSRVGLAFEVDSPAPYIEVLEGAGVTIGGGWVRGSNGLPYPHTLTENEIMVVDGDVVMGVEDIEYRPNIVAEAINATGVTNFIDAVNNAVSIVYDTIQVDQSNNNTGGNSEN